LVKCIAVNMICTFHQTLERSNEGGWYGWLGVFCINELKRNVNRDFGGEPEEMRPLGRLRGRRVDTIKVDLKGTGWGV